MGPQYYTIITKDKVRRTKIHCFFVYLAWRELSFHYSALSKNATKDVSMLCRGNQ